MERVPLVKKATFYHFLKVYEKLEHANHNHVAFDFPYALEASSAKYVPQVVFSKLLHALRLKLGVSHFVKMLKDEIALIKGSKMMASPANLVSESSFNHFLFEETPLGGQLALSSIYHSKQPSNVILEEEMFALLAMESWVESLTQSKRQVLGYQLTTDDSELLNQWAKDSKRSIYLGQPRAGLLFPKPYADIEKLTEHLQPSKCLSFSESFRFALEGYVGHQNYTLSEISEVLGIPARTIQDNLKRSGSSFRQIRDDLNVQFAQRVLLQYDISITDLSIQLGYSAPSQFVRAFKRVTQTTPYQWKKSSLAR